MINKDFGSIISSKRKEHRLSQPQLAALMGEHGLDVKAHSISKWEKNVNLPNVMQFFALCEILEITDINKTFQMGQVYVMIAFSIFPVIIVYILLSRFIVEGVSAGAVKG